MAFELYRWTFPGTAASLIGAGAALQLSASAVERQFIPISSTNIEPFGVSLATAAQAGATPPFTAAVPVVDAGNTIKITAGASLGAGADVGVANASSSWAAPVVGASGVAVWRVGRSVQPAAAGEVFGLYVSPRQLSGLV
ncbi:MAG: hypothetical protein NVSMB18_36410 [Acetobacteraceae bacterium]